MNKWLNKLIQTTLENLREEVRNMLQCNMWPFISMAAWVFLSQIPTFNPFPRGQLRSAQAGSPFSSGKYSLLLFCILLPLMLSVKPGASGMSIRPRLCEQTLKLWARDAVGKNASGVNRAVLNACRDWGIFSGCEQEGWSGVKKMNECQKCVVP
jgi:hypothetical protein